MLAILGKLLKYANRVLVISQRGILIAASLVVSIAMVVEVVTRYVLEQPLLGTEEIALLSVMWLYMMGAALASYDRSHLRAEITHLIFKNNRRTLHITGILSTFIGAVMAGFMIYWGYDLFAWGLEQRQTTPALGIPWFYSQGSIFFGGILITIYFSHEVVDRIRDMLKSQDLPVGETK